MMPDLFDIQNCPLDCYCAQDWDALIPTKVNGRNFYRFTFFEGLFLATFGAGANARNNFA